MESELYELSKDDEVRLVLTQTLRAAAMVPFLRKNYSADALYDPLENIEKYGILIPEGDFPSLDGLVRIVTEFYDRHRS